MADRQYGILPGTSLTGARLPQPRQTRSRSPSKTNMSRPQSYAEWTAGDDAAPLPPPHASLTPYSQRNEQTANPFLESSSDVSSYHPQDSSLHALRGVDNLYNPQRRTPSPEHRSPYADYQPYVPPRTDRSLEPPVSPVSALRAPVSPMAISPIQAHTRMSPTHAHPGRSPVQPHRMASPAHPYISGGYSDINPNEIADDGDDGLEEHPRHSRMGFAGAGAGAGIFSGLASRDASGNYGPLPTRQNEPKTEKSDWLQQQSSGKRRLTRTLWIGAGILLIAIIAGAVVGGVLASRKSSSGSSSSSTTSASTGSHSGGLYDINSKEVQAVMNNKDLHKVFPGMDYTPLNAQYPDCLSNMPDQNNVTLDIAMLSQLTPAVRLYGTDCNQTEMVLTAIDRLGMNDSMSVWIGVWLGTNTTTNDRQLAQMYNILNTYPSSHFAGVIVGNEVLFRKDLTLAQLSSTLSGVRSNLTAKGIKIPVATSDLGDNWTADLAKSSDIVMANVHPFFAGVKPDVAPGWTWNFWQQHDSALASTTSTSWPKSIISEVGWPSDGGNDCGTDSGSCPSGQGAVASIDNMNTFMNGFVCQSMANSTTYFWFEAFDEPWKVIFNTDSDQWESKWGLMDSNRNLKSGLKIPDCSGKTLSKPY